MEQTKKAEVTASGKTLWTPEVARVLLDLQEEVDGPTGAVLK